MSNTDAQPDGPNDAAAQPDAAQPDAAQPNPAQPEPAAPVEAPEPVITEIEQQVTLQRSVRYGRVLIVATVLGAVIAALSATLFPVQEDASYSMSQVVGFSALIGGAIGLALGGVFAIVLGAVAKRGSGTGVAIQTDVR